MHYEASIDIAAPQERVWAVLTAVERWPKWTASVEKAQVLNHPPFGLGSRVRLAQPKLSEAVWEVTRYDPTSYFEWRSKTAGVTTVAGHRVDVTGMNLSRVTLSIDQRGLLAPIVGLLYRGLIRRYLAMETQGLKRESERPGASA